MGGGGESHSVLVNYQSLLSNFHQLPLIISFSIKYSSNHVFALLISIPRLNSINFYQNRPNIKLFLLTKYKFFERWGLCPQTSVTTPITNFWLRTCSAVFTIHQKTYRHLPRTKEVIRINFQKVLALFQKNSMQY